MKRWLVFSPPYETIIDIVTDDGKGPVETVRDIVEVDAENERDAKVFGLRLLRQQRGYYEVDDTNPFNGMEAEVVPSCCSACGTEFPDVFNHAYQISDDDWRCHQCLPD